MFIFCCSWKRVEHWEGYTVGKERVVRHLVSLCINLPKHLTICAGEKASCRQYVPVKLEKGQKAPERDSTSCIRVSLI
jgi:hypothetical protein